MIFLNFGSFRGVIGGECECSGVNLEPFRADFERSEASTASLDIIHRFSKEKYVLDFSSKVHIFRLEVHIFWIDFEDFQGNFGNFESPERQNDLSQRSGGVVGPSGA